MVLIHLCYKPVFIASDAFGDPLDFRLSSPSHDIQALSSDHVEAGTHMILSVIHSHVIHIIVESQDTDVLLCL